MPVFISNARRQKKWVSTPYVSWAPKTERDLTMSTTTNQPGKIHYEEIDPNDLVIGDNVRDNADQGPEFEELVAVIKEAGQIYQPINAIIGADGSRVVTDGQRRTLAARRLGLATVPVRVLEPVAATDKQRTVERVKEQVSGNSTKPTAQRLTPIRAFKKRRRLCKPTRQTLSNFSQKTLLEPLHNPFTHPKI